MLTVYEAALNIAAGQTKAAQSTFPKPVLCRMQTVFNKMPPAMQRKQSAEEAIHLFRGNSNNTCGRWASTQRWWLAKNARTKDVLGLGLRKWGKKKNEVFLQRQSLLRHHRAVNNNGLAGDVTRDVTDCLSCNRDWNAKAAPGAQE